VRIQNDVFRIVFDGNAYVHKSAVDYYALVRAAELTVQNGREYFHVLAADTDVKTTNVFIAGQTFATSNTYGTGYSRAMATQSGEPYMAAVMGHTVPILSPLCHQRRVYSTALQKPVVTLDIQRLPRRVDPCLNARQVLQGAIEKKLKLEAATLSALGLSPA
jgi:hypothetical protein